MQHQHSTEEASPESQPAPPDMMALALIMATGLFIMLVGLLRGLQMLS